MRICWRVCALILTLILTTSLLGCSSASSSENTVGSTVQYDAGDYLVELNKNNRVVVKLPTVYMQNHAIRKQMDERICSILQDATGTKFMLEYTQSAPRIDAAWYNDGYSEYAIFLDSKLMLYNDKVVSIVFEGMMNYRSAAYPVHLFFTLNYDPNTNHEVYITDLYDVDDTLYDMFVYGVQEKIASEVNNNLSETQDSFIEKYCSQEIFSRGMSENGTFYYYFTESGVGISFPVPHVYGDHMEVEIAL